MRFKIVGVLFLLAATVFASDALRHAWNTRDSGIKAISYALIAVFLVATVRVLQAEKHHRDEVRERRHQERERRHHEEREPLAPHADQ